MTKPPRAPRAANKSSSSRVTLRDVADFAGVSMMSVSNVVNERFGSMTEETRRRIEAAIATLGYRPHVGARGLRRGQRFSLALLVIDNSPTYLAEPWMTDLVAGMTNYLIGRDYGLYVQGTDAGGVARAALLEHVATDGMCVVLSGPKRTRSKVLDQVLEAAQPIVLFQEVLREPRPDVCVVRQDDRHGGRELARLVLAGGARNLAVLSTAWEWPALVQREAGIRDAIAEAKAAGSIRMELVSCRGNGGYAETQEALSAHIAAHGLPDAIMAGSDTMAVAALRLLAVRGVAVPGQVQVTGFGGFDIRALVDPPLTTMRSPAYAVGEAGSAALLTRLETGAFPAGEIILPVTPVAGGSTTLAFPERIPDPE